ncbi:MAG: stimulus-sensing domain-containing protein [Pseudomonadota bacterium]
MADTAYVPETPGAKPIAPRRPRFVVSRLTLLIVAANTVGLVILALGALLLSQYRDGLIAAKKESLSGQGRILADVLAKTAVPPDAADPALQPEFAREVLRRLLDEINGRVRLYDATGALITDSRLLNDEIIVQSLPPIGTPEETARTSLSERLRFDALPPYAFIEEAKRRTVREEVDTALLGAAAEAVRFDEDGRLIVSVAIPIQLVQTVHGVLIMEAGEIDELVAQARLAILPFFALALGVSLGLSFVLTALIAQPIRRLATAADQVRLGLGGANRRKIPDFTKRKDEIGELSGALQDMTEALYDRLDAIESFAADVAHEIKNPLTSIRSAVETLPMAKDNAARTRLLDVIQKDVGRMDRLITDISNASRLDAELSRQKREAADLSALLKDIVAMYETTSNEGGASVRLMLEAQSPAYILGFPSTLGQVARNLIDNAKSFSPPGGEVRVTLRAAAADKQDRLQIIVEDDGPGVPPDNLESIFQRFYTERPAGAEFGKNSGLGLAIARQIVEAHRGRIWAENRLVDPHDAQSERKGARFVVDLPRAAWTT